MENRKDILMTKMGLEIHSLITITDLNQRIPDLVFTTIAVETVPFSG